MEFKVYLQGNDGCQVVRYHRVPVQGDSIETPWGVKIVSNVHLPMIVTGAEVPNVLYIDMH